jgi:hypothetical protein
MKSLRRILTAVALVSGLLMTAGLSFGTPAIAKKEGGKPCTTCHVKAGQKELNDTGKYYKEHKTLKGAPEAPAAPAK